jgi:hypothetical protein
MEGQPVESNPILKIPFLKKTTKEEKKPQAGNGHLAEAKNHLES